GLREFAGVGGDQPLDPFALAKFAKLLVVDFASIEGLSPESRDHLLGAATNEWSGGACSRPLPDGWRLVILNPAHGNQRNRATLMEEILPWFFGPQPNRLPGVGRASKTLAPDYKHDDEGAGYAVGGAAVVPFQALRRLVLAGHPGEQISRRFHVS